MADNRYWKRKAKEIIALVQSTYDPDILENIVSLTLQIIHEEGVIAGAKEVNERMRKD